jgi:hypothetical protein
MKVKYHDGWFLIQKKRLFAATIASREYINLAINQGEDMVYDKLPYTYIDYPGEYDLDGTFLRVFADKQKKLHYLIKDNNLHFAIIQSPKALDFEGMDEADIFYYTDDVIADKIDKMELEGKKEKLIVPEETIA